MQREQALSWRDVAPTSILTWSFQSTWQPPGAPSTSLCIDCAPSEPGPFLHGWSAGAELWECCPAEGRSTASANKRWKGIDVSTGQVRRQKDIPVSALPFLLDYTPPHPTPFPNEALTPDKWFPNYGPWTSGFWKPRENRTRITTKLKTLPREHCHEGALVICKSFWELTAVHWPIKFGNQSFSEKHSVANSATSSREQKIMLSLPSGGLGRRHSVSMHW